MKSIVEEASSLAKAFSQAWERADKPQECTVKILAEPEKNFIGMTTKSAKIAVFFNEVAAAQSKKSSTQSSNRPSSPQKHTAVQTQQQSRTQQPTRTQNSRQESRPVEHRSNEQRSTEQKPVEHRLNEQRSSEQRPRQQRSSEQRSGEQRPVEQRTTEKPRTVTPRETLSRENSLHDTTQHEAITKPDSVAAAPRVRPIWTEEMNLAVRAWVEESLQIMSRTDVVFNTSMSRAMLTITFTAPLIEDREKERLLFRSWSHLIVQHIKQEFKVHGKEFKIILKGSRTSL